MEAVGHRTCRGSMLKPREVRKREDSFLEYQKTQEVRGRENLQKTPHEVIKAELLTRALDKPSPILTTVCFIGETRKAYFIQTMLLFTQL